MPIRESGLNRSEGKPGIATKAVCSAETGFVLAGGLSSRMGRDKALALFGGRPLIETAIETLRLAGAEPGIAGSRPDLSRFAPVVNDRESGSGPLAGICAAMEATAAQRFVFVSVDQPLLPASLLRSLIAHACITGRAVTLASVNGSSQTFPAVLDRAVLPCLEAALSSGQRGCCAAFVAAARTLGQRVSLVAAELLAQTGHAAHPAALPAAWWFINANSPEELERAEAIAGWFHAPGPQTHTPRSGGFA